MEEARQPQLAKDAELAEKLEAEKKAMQEAAAKNADAEKLAAEQLAEFEVAAKNAQVAQEAAERVKEQMDQEVETAKEDTAAAKDLSAQAKAEKVSAERE